MKWYVLYTKPQSELKAVQQLEKLGFEVFCPVTKEVRQWSDRKKLVKAPLFKSYIFVRLQEADRNKVFQAVSVVRYLFWLQKPAIVREEEIETIKTWLNDSSYEGIQVHSLAPGEKVEILNGALKGKKGVVKEVGKRKVKMFLESLNVVVETNLRDVVD